MCFAKELLPVAPGAESNTNFGFNVDILMFVFTSLKEGGT